MKVVARINPKTGKPETFIYYEPGPIPPVVDPENPEEAKDGGVPGPDEQIPEKPKPS